MVTVEEVTENSSEATEEIESSRIEGWTELMGKDLLFRVSGFLFTG